MLHVYVFTDIKGTNVPSCEGTNHTFSGIWEKVSGFCEFNLVNSTVILNFHHMITVDGMFLGSGAISSIGICSVIVVQAKICKTLNISTL